MRLNIEEALKLDLNDSTVRKKFPIEVVVPLEEKKTFRIFTAALIQNEKGEWKMQLLIKSIF